MKLERSALAKVFVGQLRSTLKCQKCHHESLTFDPFWELSVSMQKVLYHQYMAIVVYT